MIQHDNRVPKLLELRAQGLTLEECGQQLGCSESAVARILRTYTAQGGRPAWSYPSQALLTEVAAARREMQAILKARGSR